jgi:hypothetical protein
LEKKEKKRRVGSAKRGEKKKVMVPMVVGKLNWKCKSPISYSILPKLKTQQK